MKIKYTLSIVFLWMVVVVQAQNYTPFRIYESGTYDYSGEEKYNFQIEPFYSHYIEVKGEIKAGKEFITVKPNTILKEVILGVFIPPCDCRLEGGEKIDGNYGDRDRVDEKTYLLLANTTNTLTMRSSLDSDKKIIRYIIYDSNGNMMLYNNVTPTQQVEVNITWLPLGIYYAYAVFEDYYYEGKPFQK